MPFAMTHLCIARGVSERRSAKIDNMPQFYLGSIAPDSIHYRGEYVSDMKKASHLCVGSERWGMATNNGEWAENVLRFLERNKGTANDDFILGYCIHILSDIYNNIAVWTPFRKKYMSDADERKRGLYHLESGKVDIQLAQTVEGIDSIRKNLESARGIDLGGFVFAHEIEEQRTSILYRQYEGKGDNDTSQNEVVTFGSTLDFIGNAVEFVIDKLPKG